MENITEWVGKFEKNTRNKPNQQLQKELFHRIQTVLAEKTNTFDECVSAFCRFDARVIDNFYDNEYWMFSDEDRTNWDLAMVRWAGTNTGKQSIRATVRIVPIIKMKLPKIASADGVMAELQWLSMNGDDRSASAFKQLRDSSKVSNLRKLLTLDMSNWKAGKVQIFKMYGILFANSIDPETKKLYAEFLCRNGETVAESPVGAGQEQKEEDTPSVIVTESVETAQPKEPNPVSTVVEPNEPSEPVADELPAKPEKAEMPTDGVALAEALLRWTQDQKARILNQASSVANLNVQLQKAQAQIVTLTEQVSEQQAMLDQLINEKNALNRQLQEANETIVTLEDEKAKAEDTIGQVQQMSGNSVKQELDGFRAKLASALANDVKDFRQEYSDEEKAEVYAAFMEDMIDILKSNGIAVEG